MPITVRRVEYFYVMVRGAADDAGELLEQLAAQYINPGDFIADMKTKGGAVKYLQWLIAEINKALTTLFGSTVTPPPSTVEPTNDDEAMTYIQAALAGMHLTVTNGVPTLA